MNKTKTMTPQVFAHNDYKAWQSHLTTQGYVVIGNILTDAERLHMFTIFAKDWNHVSPTFDFSNKTTWIQNNSPVMWNKGMAYASGFGQSNFMWELRTHETILDIWSHIHNTSNLVTSFDGFSIFLSGKQRSKSWLHVDQKTSDDQYSIQGAYNFLPVGEDDAGFVVVPGSHQTYVTPETAKGNFIQISEDDPHRSLAVKLLIPANSFVLWNSKTIHANVGMSDRKACQLNRLTAYISMFPKSERSDAVRERRMQGYLAAETTGHWATRHDVKRHPYGTKTRYENRGFLIVEPRLTGDNHIPPKRLALI